MKAPINKIVCEVLEEKATSETGILVSDNFRKNWVKGKVLAVSDEFPEVVEDDELIVFDVVEAQIKEYNEQKLIFVDGKDGNYFVI